MKKYLQSALIILLMGTAISLNAQNASASIKGEEITYSDGATVLKGYVAFNEEQEGKRPAIIVVPEWWGCGKIANNPGEAQAFAGVFYKDPALGKSRIEAAIKKISSYAQTDVNKLGAIGYCFGGSMVLNAAKLGMDFKGVVSFHGGLAGVPAAPGVTKAKILVCHGGADKFVSDGDIKNFKDNLDAVKVAYAFNSYDGATHAFSNPDATATGKKFSMPIEYNEAADKQSWNDMKEFLGKVF